MAPLRTSDLSSLPVLVVMFMVVLGCPKESSETGSPPEADADTDADADSDTDTGPFDADGDGVPASEDCDDEDPMQYPGADEYCNGEDDDCDGTSDEDAVDADTWYVDGDGDGYGNDTDTGTTICDQLSGYTSDNTDCDDLDASIHPMADEYCDGVDTDCDGTLDEDDALDAQQWYPDLDGDGFGDPAGTPVTSCNAVSCCSSTATDCDDTDSSVFPTAHDVCNDGIDQDCTGADKSCPYTGTVLSSAAQVVITGEPSLSYTPHSIGSVGDIDGDGAAEIIFGNGYDNSIGENSGAVWLFHGGLSHGIHSIDDAEAVLLGADELDYLGVFIGGGDDVDGDGLLDVAVGAWYADYATDWAGAAYILSADVLSGEVSVEAAEIQINGENEYDFAGSVLTGDFDGDTLADLVVGMYGSDTGGTNSGAAMVFRGPVDHGVWGVVDADVLLVGPPGGSLGAYFTAGDLDGSGAEDLAFGCQTDSSVLRRGGSISVWYDETLSTAEQSPDADLRIHPEGDGDMLGNGIAAGSDINGDGYGDLAATAPYYGAPFGYWPGRAYLFHGPLGTGTALAADADVKLDGRTTDYVETAWMPGDVNGDGYGDVAFATPQSPPGENLGTIHLFFGPVSSSLTSIMDADAIFEGLPEQNLGESINTNVKRAPGDVDGDGFADLVFPAGRDDTAGANVGAIYVFLGGP